MRRGPVHHMDRFLLAENYSRATKTRSPSVKFGNSQRDLASRVRRRRLNRLCSIFECNYSTRRFTSSKFNDILRIASQKDIAVPVSRCKNVFFVP